MFEKRKKNLINLVISLVLSLIVSFEIYYNDFLETSQNKLKILVGEYCNESRMSCFSITETKRVIFTNGNEYKIEIQNSSYKGQEIPFLAYNEFETLTFNFVPKKEYINYGMLKENFDFTNKNFDRIYNPNVEINSNNIESIIYYKKEYGKN